MAIKNKLTFMVVTCYMDMILLDRFLSSIRNFCNKDDLHEIILILNDQYKYLSDLQELVEKYSTLPIRYKWSNELWPEQDQYDWYSQQHLKLVVADMVETEWYIIQDSKDFYTTKIGYSDFVDSDGRSLQSIKSTDYTDSWLGINGYHYQQYKNAYELFGLEYTDYQYALRTWIASICPVHTQTIRDLVAHLRSQFGTLFPWILLLQRKHKEVFTEYALISAWLHKNNLMLEQYQLDPPGLLGYNIKASSNKDLRRKKTA